MQKTQGFLHSHTFMGFSHVWPGIFAKIDLFTVVCLVAWPLNESEAGLDLVLIETSLLLLC